jgi:hypothetical protein
MSELRGMHIDAIMAVQSSMSTAMQLKFPPIIMILAPRGWIALLAIAS